MRERTGQIEEPRRTNVGPIFPFISVRGSRTMSPPGRRSRLIMETLIATARRPATASSAVTAPAAA